MTVSPDGAPLLVLERISKVYRRGLLDRAPAFQLDVDRIFERPEIVGVMGPNGAGKTTLFEMIAGSNVPTAGRVVVLSHGQVAWSGRAATLAGDRGLKHQLLGGVA
jgi:ABC-type multidrug transport system ATPase subunit